MISDNEAKINRAIDAIKNGLTQKEAAQHEGIPISTLSGRLNGILPRKTTQEQSQILSPMQESILEAWVINRLQSKTSPTATEVMKMAGKIRRYGNPDAPIPSRTWLNKFLKRSNVLVWSNNKIIDAPSIKDSGENEIRLFFERLSHWEATHGVTPDRVWSLDESGFQVGETPAGLVITPDGCVNNMTGTKIDRVTVMEMISGDGKILEPLLIYQGVSEMEAWFPKQRNQSALLAMSDSSYINSKAFFAWITECFPVFEDKWQVLILNGCKAHTSTEVMEWAWKHNILLLFLPEHMSNVLQPFGAAKQQFQSEIQYQLADGLTPSKQLIFENYLKIRNTAYSPKVLEGAWARTGIFPRRVIVAVNAYRTQMNLPLLLATIENNQLFYSGSEISPPESGENATSTLETESTCPEVLKRPPWRSERMYLASRPPLEVANLLYSRGLAQDANLEKAKAKIRTLEAQVVVYQDQVKYLHNQLIQMKRNKSTRQKKSGFDKNKEVMKEGRAVGVVAENSEQLLTEENTEENCGMVGCGVCK